MYRIVATDMDETFLGANHQIPPANLEAMRLLRDAGVLLVPSSGRPYHTIMGNFAGIDQSLLEGTYVISFNGGFINRYGDPMPLTTCHIDHDAADSLYRQAREMGLCQHIYNTSGRMVVVDADEEEVSYISSIPGAEFASGEGHPDVSSFFGADEVVKVIYASSDFAGLQTLGERLRPELAACGIDVTYSSGRYVEFVCAGVNKGAGLAHLAKLLDIPIEETIGIGDSSNDLEMIKAAGLGVGVANVTDDVRPHCDAVLETRGEDGAFLELYDRFVAPQLPETRA